MRKKAIILISLLAVMSFTACSKMATGVVETVVAPEITVPAVVELVTNGSFTSDEWKTDDSNGSSWGGSGGDVTVDYTTNEAVTTVVKGDSSVNFEAQLYTTVALETGKTYTVSFDYSSDVSAPLGFSIENSSTYAVYLDESTTDKKASLTANVTKQTYTHTFTATETNPTAKVVFLLSSAPTGAKITVDNVSIKNDIELVTNGNFTSDVWKTDDSNGTSWGGSGGDVTVDYTTNEAVATVVKGDSSVNFEAQLYTTVALEAGKTYTVSFDYSSDVSAPLGFSIENSSTYAVYLDESTTDKKASLTVNTTKQVYTHTFIATETNPVAKVVFLLSSAPTGAKITIDNVSIKD